MTAIVKDRVCETTSTTGTGALALVGAVTGYSRFSDRMSVGDTCFYAIEGIDANGVPTGEWETGLGTYSGVNTLTRTTVHASSNSDAAVSFSAGTKRVYISTTARQLAALTEATDVEVWTGTSTATIVTPRRALSANIEQAVTFASTITLDGNTGFNFSTTLTGNLALANPTNFKSGQSGFIFLTQDGTGSRTLTLGGNWKFIGGAPTLSTAASAVDVISYYVRPSGVIACSIGKAVS